MSTRHFTIIILIGLLFWQCKSDDDQPKKNGNGTPGETTSFEPHFSFRWDNQIIFDQHDVYFTDDNRPVKVEFPQVYLSQFALIDSKGDTTMLKDVVLMKQGNNKIKLGDVDSKKEYTELIFDFGIRHAVNKGVQPVDFSPGHPLAPQVPSMWWSWDYGYIFGRIEGATNHENPPVNDMVDNFSWHIGFSENHSPGLSFDVSGMPLSKINIVFDIKMLFENINVPGQVYSENSRFSEHDKAIAILMSESIVVVSEDN